MKVNEKFSSLLCHCVKEKHTFFRFPSITWLQEHVCVRKKRRKIQNSGAPKTRLHPFSNSLPAFQGQSNELAFFADWPLKAIKLKLHNQPKMIIIAFEANRSWRKKDSNNKRWIVMLYQQSKLELDNKTLMEFRGSCPFSFIRPNKNNVWFWSQNRLVNLAKLSGNQVKGSTKINDPKATCWRFAFLSAVVQKIRETHSLLFRT